ncbi:MAG: lysostaphin resistance A-like protein [Suipraeoptans sp.]
MEPKNTLEQEIKESRKRFFRLWSPVLLHQAGLIAGSFAMTFIVIIIYAMRYPQTIEKAAADQDAMQTLITTLSNITNQYSLFAIGIGSFILIFIFIRMYQKDKNSIPATEVREKNGSVKYLILVGISICVHYVLNNLIFVSEIDKSTESYTQIQELFYSPSIGVQLVVLVLITPICEELVYRGLVYRRLRERSGFIRAGILSSLIFSFVHGNIVQMIYAFCVGMLFAYLCEKFNTVIAPIIAHALMNLMSIVLTDVGFYNILVDNTSILMITTIVVSGVGAVLFLYIMKINENDMNNQKINKK